MQRSGREGDNRRGQCDIPEPEEGVEYVQAAAGVCHTVLLRSDGRAVAVGLNKYGQRTLPALDEGSGYVQVAARYHRTVLGATAAPSRWARTGMAECEAPPLDEGTQYVQVVAAMCQSVLFRSDGRAVAVGSNRHGQPTQPRVTLLRT